MTRSCFSSLMTMTPRPAPERRTTSSAYDKPGPSHGKRRWQSETYPIAGAKNPTPTTSSPSLTFMNFLPNRVDGSWNAASSNLNPHTGGTHRDALADGCCSRIIWFGQTKEGVIHRVGAVVRRGRGVSAFSRI